MAEQRCRQGLTEILLRTLDADEQRRTRIAWLYYVEGKTQGEIAAILGLHRLKVNRELAICRERGMVQTRIDGALASCVALERKLQNLYGLRGAVVVPTPEREPDVATVVGMALGHFISDHLQPGMTIGIGWGRTLRWSVRSLRQQHVPNLTVVSLMGGLGRASDLNTYETASRFAERYEAPCYYFAAPTFVETEELREMLLRQSWLRSVYDRGRKADMTITSVGALTSTSTVLRIGLLTPAEMRSLQQAGAVGDLLCHFLDAQGNLVDHPLNRRVVGLAPSELAHVGTRVVVGGGRDKLAILRAVLRGRLIDVLITDETNASGLCRDSD
jgi:DNA-binding transcriptional regulator LsrR (DeoR family)